MQTLEDEELSDQTTEDDILIEAPTVRPILRGELTRCPNESVGKAANRRERDIAQLARSRYSSCEMNTASKILRHKAVPTKSPKLCLAPVLSPHGRLSLQEIVGTSELAPDLAKR